jgi:hypothetical protein
MIKLRCDCCGHVEQFETESDAFDEGWDCAPYFKGFVACGLCPAVFANGFGKATEGHLRNHQKWKDFGRPE